MHSPSGPNPLKNRYVYSCLSQRPRTISIIPFCPSTSQFKTLNCLREHASEAIYYTFTYKSPSLSEKYTFLFGMKWKKLPRNTLTHTGTNGEKIPSFLFSTKNKFSLVIICCFFSVSNKGDQINNRMLCQGTHENTIFHCLAASIKFTKPDMILFNFGLVYLFLGTHLLHSGFQRSSTIVQEDSLFSATTCNIACNEDVLIIQLAKAVQIWSHSLVKRRSAMCVTLTTIAATYYMRSRGLSLRW